jgi:hypothetical protein
MPYTTHEHIVPDGLRGWMQQRNARMAIDKHNSLQFLMFGQRSYFEEFGDVDGVYVDRVPFELRDPPSPLDVANPQQR